MMDKQFATANEARLALLEVQRERQLSPLELALLSLLFEYCSRRLDEKDKLPPFPFLEAEDTK